MRMETRWLALYGSFLIGSTNFRDLPVLFAHFQHDLELDVSHLGQLMGLQGVCHVLGVCFFGYYSCRAQSRMKLLGYCTLVWAAGTFLTAICSNATALFISRAFIGLSSGVVGPVSQCLVAEWVAPVGRGRAFAWAVAMDFAGQTLAAAGLAWLIQVLGSWRLPLLFMVCTTLVFAAFAFAAQKSEPKREASEVANLPWLEQVARVFGTPSMRVIILQGFLASTQKEVNSLIDLWFQQCSFDATTAAELYSAMVFGNLMGSVFAGYVSDVFASRAPNYGRLIFGQVGEFWRLPALCLLLRVGPSAEFTTTFACALLYGSTQSLNYVGAVKPLCTEAVPPALVGSAIAIAATVDGAFASAAGGPLVGWSAQFLFGYTQGNMDPSNRDALQRALSGVLTISWLGTVSLLSFLYWTFPRDRMQAMLASQAHDDAEVGLLTPPAIVNPLLKERPSLGLQATGLADAPETPPKCEAYIAPSLTPDRIVKDHVIGEEASARLLKATACNDDMALPLLLAAGESKATCRRGRTLRMHASDPTHCASWESCHAGPIQPVNLRVGARRQLA